MKTARVLFCSIFFVLFAFNVSAQSRMAPKTQESFVTPIGLPRPLPARPMVLQGANFKVTGMDSAWQDLSDGTIHVVVDTVSNLTNDSVTIYFSRSEQIACAMSTSVCWGALCYPPTKDSATFTIPANGKALLSLDMSASLDDITDSGLVWLRVGAVGSPSDTVLLYFTGTYTPPDPPLIFQWSQPVQFEQTYNGSGIDTFSNLLENHACHGINYVLSYQASLPAGWSITKFDDVRQPSNPSNYQDTFTTGNTLVSNFSAFPDTTYQQRLTFTLNAPAVTKQDTAVIYLSVHPQTSNSADSANYQFAMIVMPQDVVGTTPEDRAGIAVTNAWPNPLVGTGMLHLEIQTDASGNAKALIYDLSGSEKGTLELGSLHVGTNEVQASAPALSSGEYILRVVQDGSASEIVRINYVK